MKYTNSSHSNGHWGHICTPDLLVQLNYFMLVWSKTASKTLLRVSLSVTNRWFSCAQSRNPSKIIGCPNSNLSVNDCSKVSATAALVTSSVLYCPTSSTWPDPSVLYGHCDNGISGELVALSCHNHWDGRWLPHILHHWDLCWSVESDLRVWGRNDADRLDRRVTNDRWPTSRVFIFRTCCHLCLTCVWRAME